MVNGDSGMGIVGCGGGGMGNGDSGMGMVGCGGGGCGGGGMVNGDSGMGIVGCGGGGMGNVDSGMGIVGGCGGGGMGNRDSGLWWWWYGEWGVPCIFVCVCDVYLCLFRQDDGPPTWQIYLEGMPHPHAQDKGGR